MDTERLERAARAQMRACIACLADDAVDPCEDCYLDAQAVIDAYLGDDEVYVIDLSDERQVDQYQFGGYLTTLKRRKILVPLNREGTNA